MARQIVREACAEWGTDQDGAETGTLLISEIVTNAVRHGHSHSLRVIAEQPRPDRLRVAVVDKSRRVPELHIVGRAWFPDHITAPIKHAIADRLQHGALA